MVLRSRRSFAGPFEAFVASFKWHLVSGRYGVDVGAMRAVAEMPEHRHLVVVPDAYEVAYRLMWNVREKHLAEVLRGAPDVERVGVCAPHKAAADRVSSWTVSLDALMPDARQFITPRKEATVPGPDGGYAVLVAAPIHPWTNDDARRFWLNPDEIYEATGEYEAAVEREVVSVGSVGRVWMSYVRAADHGDDRTWGELMTWLVERAYGRDEEILACGRRGNGAAGAN